MNDDDKDGMCDLFYLIGEQLEIIEVSWYTTLFYGCKFFPETEK